MIAVEDVFKEFWHDRTRHWVVALSRVQLRVKPCEFVCVLGPSGCGKSTLLNLIAGFEQPTAGRVLFAGLDVVGPGPDRGVVFQEHTLFPWLTAAGNIEFGLRNLRVPTDERKEMVRDALALVGLDGFAEARPHQLSGGMRQRGAIARVLAMEPKALLLDEPFGALDALARNRLQDELIRIWETHKRTVVFVTHNVDEAVYLADRVILMGPSPRSIRSDIRVDLPRPRDRTSPEVREVVLALERELREMPCCVPANGLSDDPTQTSGGELQPCT